MGPLRNDLFEMSSTFLQHGTGNSFGRKTVVKKGVASCVAEGTSIADPSAGGTFDQAFETGDVWMPAKHPLSSDREHHQGPDSQDIGKMGDERIHAEKDVHPADQGCKLKYRGAPCEITQALVF
jgi:hypothetical protein